jgi:DNA-binding CsgD family transcriptional regulator
VNVSRLQVAEPAPLGDPEGLSDEARQLLEVAAVFGRTFSVDDLAEVLGERIGRILEVLRETLAADVLIPDGPLLVFREGNVQKELYRAMPDPIRNTLHHRIGTMLLQQSGSAVRAAAHLIAAALPHDGDSLAALDKASQELSVSAPQAAADLALRALQMTALGDPDRSTRTAAAVDVLVRAKRVAEAAALIRDALGRPGVPAACASRLRIARSAMLLTGGKASDALAEADAVLAGPGLSDGLADVAVVARLSALFVLDDAARIQEAAEAILAGSDRPGGDATLAMASLGLAWVAWDDGRLTGALGLVEAAARRFDRCEPGHGYGMYLRLSQAMMLISLGDLDGAEVALLQAADEIEVSGATLYGPAPALLRARLHLAAGRLDEAAASARAALAAAEDVQSGLFVPLAFATLARVSLLRDEVHDAAGHLARCRGHADAPHARFGGFASTWTTAALAGTNDGPEAARKVLDDLYVALPARPVLLLEVPEAASSLTRLALATGDHALAEVVAGCAERLVRTSPGFPSVRAGAAHARGLLNGDAGLLAEAEADYPQPLAAASAAEDAGLVLTRRHGEDAQEAFERALAGYERLGAVADAARVRSRLRALGVRPCHWSRAERPPAGWLSLTEGEMRVAQVVAQGATNAQAAARLFLSRHTVDFHLRQIFRKLGIRSRVELTRFAIQNEPDRAGSGS